MSNNNNNGSKPDGSIKIGNVVYDIYLREQGQAKMTLEYNGSDLENETNNINTVSSGHTFPSSGGAKKGKKEKKEKSGKTRKLSPYMKFAQEARKNIIAEHPEWKSDIIKVGKEIGAKWRALSDSDKSKY
jgi:hypothetical protein